MPYIGVHLWRATYENEQVDSIWIDIGEIMTNVIGADVACLAGWLSDIIFVSAANKCHENVDKHARQDAGAPSRRDKATQLSTDGQNNRVNINIQRAYCRPTFSFL